MTDLAQTEHPVIVIGAGIAGAACARVLHDGGARVKVLDRGRRVGGRMALRTEQVAGRSHVVDIGASYFTVHDERFAQLAAGWRAAGLAAPWTDTFAQLTPHGAEDHKTGPMRWSAANGLRSLVEALLSGLDVTSGHEVEQVDVDSRQLTVDGTPAAAVVLAMPEPQAHDLLPEPIAAALQLGSGLDWSPSFAVWAGWSDRWWQPREGGFAGAFVDDSPIISWVADDGSRRGDAAPVLVVHTTSTFAAARLDAPQTVPEPVLAELARLFQSVTVPVPDWVRGHRWSLSAPRHPHQEPFGLYTHGTESTDGTGLCIGVCGDAWGPKPRIEQAWISGHELGLQLLSRWRAGAIPPGA